jgi:hypothetical protein
MQVVTSLAVPGMGFLAPQAGGTRGLLFFGYIPALLNVFNKWERAAVSLG